MPRGHSPWCLYTRPGRRDSTPDAPPGSKRKAALHPLRSRQVRRLRDHRFGIAVRIAYHERCSLCEVGYRVRGRPLGLEAAHLIPVEERGTSSDVRNGILLCRNHHALLDAYAWAPDEDLRVRVADDDAFRDSAAANHVLSWEGRRLPNLPGRDELMPAGEAIRHRMDRFDGFWRG